MHKVLIICGSFPPQSDVGGLRPAMMAKYLPEYGWEPIVLTKDYGNDHGRRDFRMHIDGLDHVQVMRVEVTAREEEEYLRTRGLIWKLRHFLEIEKSFPPAEYEKLWQFAHIHLTGEKINAIYATAPDFPPLRIGRDLSKETGAPWIADFRDISEQEDGIYENWRDAALRTRSLIRRRMLVQTSSLLTSVSRYHCKTLEKKTRKPCRLVYNGYDHVIFKPVNPSRHDRFSIIYVGRLLSKEYRNPELLFKALDALLSENKVKASDIELSFYATEPDILKSIIKGFLSSQCCRIKDRVEHSKLPDVLSKASVLLLLSEYNRNGVLSTKLFEYLAMERPILCIRTEPDAEMAQLIRKANVGYAGDDIEAVKNFLLVHYEIWKKQGYCTSNPDRRYISQFSRREQAGILANILNESISNKK